MNSSFPARTAFTNGPLGGASSPGFIRSSAIVSLPSATAGRLGSIVAGHARAFEGSDVARRLAWRSGRRIGSLEEARQATVGVDTASRLTGRAVGRDALAEV